jgi:hypothetical protein
MDCLHLNPMTPDDEELLNFALDEEDLPESKRAHLEQCEVCQQRLARYKQVNAHLISQVYRSLCPSGTQLSFYCADLVPPEQRTRIAAHILDCPLCAAEVADTRSFIREVPIDDLELPDPVFSPARAVRRIFGKLVRQQAQLVTRNGGGHLPAKGWPRQYRADSIDFSLHLTRASSGAYMLLGILTSVDSAESVDAFEGAQAEIYPAPFAGDTGDGNAPAPVRQALVDDLGNIVFSGVPVGEYALIIHLPGQEVVIEGIDIEHG